jgi:hypothetical protein
MGRHTHIPELLLLIFFFGVLPLLYFAFNWMKKIFFPEEYVLWKKIGGTYPDDPYNGIQMPSFSDQTIYSVRGVSYGQWRTEFLEWLKHRTIKHKVKRYSWLGSRMLDGKDWAAEDRQWAKHYEIWHRDIYRPEETKRYAHLKQINESHKSQLIGEFISVYARQPKSYHYDRCTNIVRDFGAYSPVYDKNGRLL